MSIPELFDVGSEDTGWWAMRGMPWPIEELAKRPENEVVEEAIRRIEELKIGRYVDAFLVTVLLRLNVENLNEILIDHYDQLDDAGKYEVLLYAADTNAEGYTDFFADAVKRVMPDPELNRTAVLAAIYQSVAADPDLHIILSEYVNSHSESGKDNYRSIHLDGFPYSDVILRSVIDVDELFRQTLQIGEYDTSHVNDPMNSEERQLLDQIRQALLEPERKSLNIEEKSLAEVLRDLGLEFPGFRVNSLSKEFRTATDKASVSGIQLSLVDALAQLCNQRMLSILSSSHEENTWSISQGNRYGYGATNNCVSTNGFLVSLRPFYSEFRDQPRITFSIKVGTSSTWLNYTEVRVLIESVVTERKIEEEKYPALFSRNRVNIPLGDNSPEDLGAITVSGIVELTVPTSLKHIEIGLSGQQEFSLERGARRLTFNSTPEEVTVSWGLTSVCCGWVQPPLLIDPGNIALFDEEGKMPDITKSGINSSWGNRAGGLLGFGRSDRNPWNPSILTWTYAPTVEKIRIPVTFENMQLVPKLTEPQ